MTLRRYKVASVLNIVGLTMAFVAFFVIASQVWYSVSYNRPLKDSDKVYMISGLWDKGGETESWSSTCPTPVSKESVEMFPQALQSTHFREYPAAMRVWGKSEHGDFRKYNINSYDFSPDGLDVFGFDIISGDAEKIDEPNTVILSESTAEKMGVEVGEQIYFEGGEWFNNMKPEQPQTVVAIFKDFPKNTFLYDHHIFRDDNCKDGEGNNNWNYCYFVKFSEGADLEQFKKIWMDKYATWMLGQMQTFRELYPDMADEIFEEGDEIQPIRLISLNKMYYEGNTNSKNFESGTYGSTLTLAAIAVLIVVIAFINFVNFFMALVPVRLRSVNICKVYGAGQGVLRAGFLFEAIGLVLVAFILALGIILALQGSFITEYVTSSLALKDNIAVLLIIFVLLMALAVIAAAYPAFYITKFNAALAVKDGYANSLSGRRMRLILVGFQFTIAMVLIIVSASFYMQYKYMSNYDIGLDRENVVTFASFDLVNKGNVVVEKLQQWPQVEDVTASTSAITQLYSRWGNRHNDKDFMLNVWPVRYNFPDFFGIEMVDGEMFTDQSHNRKDMLVTANINSEVGIPLQHYFNGYNVCGFVKDVKLAPAEDNVSYVGIYCTDRFGNYYVRLQSGADVPAFSKYVKEMVQELSPGSDEPEVMFLNQAIGNLYNSTKNASILIGMFALLAVLISLMGVFGIVMFETQHRRREIAIRKVYGAEQNQLVGMLNSRYIITVLVCFAVAAPVAAVIVSKWLEQFANKVSVPWWVFGASLLGVLTVTVILVSLRSYRAASENPADVVKGL